MVIFEEQKEGKEGGGSWCGREGVVRAATVCGVFYVGACLENEVLLILGKRR